MKPRPGYKTTFMDRHGPEGAVRIKAAGYAASVFGTTVGVALARGAPLGMTLLGAFTLSVAVFFGAMRITKAAGDAFRYFTAGGSSTPYEEQFSREQALVMQRDYAGALALFEQRIAQAPREPRVRMAAADLYTTHGENPRRAAELYREVQRIPDVMSGHDIYASNKLADLYLGPLREPRRALVEFRRLIERYPGTAAAKHAKAALTNVKGNLDDAQSSS